MTGIGSPGSVRPGDVDAEVTIRQAADLLGTSHPYVVRLFEEGVIPHRRAGGHHRIPLTALLAYRRRDDEQRRRTADELGDLGQELGI